MKHNIMFVDDYTSVLESLQWIFKDEPYYLFFFNDPFNALNVIKKLEWAVVVAELSMQTMNGLEFMKRFKMISPQTMGIIMTSYNENSAALDILYPDCVSKFVKKPLDNIEIKQAVKTAVGHYKLTIENIKQMDAVCKMKS